jgi:HemY protein
MRTIFIYVLFALLLGVGVVALIETDPGYVLVSYGNYTMETSLWVGLLLLGLLLLLAYAVFRLIYSLVSGQRSFTTWLGSRKAHLAVRHSTSGLIHFIEGDWNKARRELVRGAQRMMHRYSIIYWLPDPATNCRSQIKCTSIYVLQVIRSLLLP